MNNKVHIVFVFVLNSSFQDGANCRTIFLICALVVRIMAICAWIYFEEMWDFMFKMPYILAIIQYFYQTKPSFCIFCGSEKLPDDINSDGEPFRWLLIMWSGFTPFPGPLTPPPPPWLDAFWFIKLDSGVIPPNSFTIGIELGWSIGPVIFNEIKVAKISQVSQIYYEKKFCKLLGVYILKFKHIYVSFISIQLLENLFCIKSHRTLSRKKNSKCILLKPKKYS